MSVPPAQAPDYWPRYTFPVLGAVTGALIVLHLASAAVEAWLQRTGLFADIDTVHELLDRVNLDREAAVPSWFATVLLFSCALVLGLIGSDARRRSDPRAGYWTALAVILALASLDESAALHELLNPLIGYLLPAADGGLPIGWWAPMGVLLAAAAIAFLPFFASLDGRDRARFALALGLYVGGSLVLEVVASLLPQDRSLALDALHALEEGLELAGILVFLRALRDIRRAGRTVSADAR